MQFFTDMIINKGSDPYRIECLQGEKVLDTRPLWEEVFFEDSRAFTDYYFAQKAPSNTTFVCRHLSTGQIVSMVHLTPYDMTIRNTNVPTFYIVGVATKDSHRHRGLMSTLLKEAFNYAALHGCPFVFLMPADPAIYKPFGFSYVYARPQYGIPEVLKDKEVYISQFSDACIHVKRIEREASYQILSALSDFAAKILSAGYDYYLTRTPAYYGTLLLELYAQNGCIYTFFLHERLEGYFLYTEEEKRPFIQELLFSEKLRSFICFKNYVNLFPAVLPDCKPIIMAKNLLPLPMVSPAPMSLTGLPDGVGDESKSAPFSTFAASLSDIGPTPSSDDLFSSMPQNPDYVNYLSTHKGFINEIV